MATCEKCQTKAENLRGLGQRRPPLPSLVKVGESADGEIYCCPQCGAITSVKKKGVQPKPDSPGDANGQS